MTYGSKYRRWKTDRIMEIVLDRKYKKDTYTLGEVTIDGVFFSMSLEDKDRGLTQAMSEDEIMGKKVYGETAIPTGRYEVKLTFSNKFKRILPILLNVKGFDGIRIHRLNTAIESHGCIGLGRNSSIGTITESTRFELKIVSLLQEEEKQGNRSFITIK